MKFGISFQKVKKYYVQLICFPLPPTYSLQPIWTTDLDKVNGFENYFFKKVISVFLNRSGLWKNVNELDFLRTSTVNEDFGVILRNP